MREKVVDVRVRRDSSIDADQSGIAVGVIAGILERLDGVLQEDPLLWVDDLGLPRVVAEELGIEKVCPFEDPAGADVAPILEQRGLCACRQEGLVREERDRFGPAHDVVPELGDVASSGKAARHADYRDLEARCLGILGDFHASIHRLACLLPRRCLRRSPPARLSRPWPGEANVGRSAGARLKKVASDLTVG
jgi:hypothetical protein